MRNLIDGMKPGTFCVIHLSSGHTINAYRDTRPTSDGPSGWFAYFYETFATGRRLRDWTVSGNSIVALSEQGEP